MIEHNIYWVMSRGRVTRDSSWQWWARPGVIVEDAAGPRAAAASLLRRKHNKAENINYIRWHRQPAADMQTVDTFQLLKRFYSIFTDFKFCNAKVCTWIGVINMIYPWQFQL